MRAETGVGHVVFPTADDASGQRMFTQGYSYEGFGAAYLDVVRDHLRH